MHRIKMALMGA